MADMSRVNDWLGTIPSKQTRKSYLNGIRKFEEFLQKPIEGLLSVDDTELGHTVERYYSWLSDQGVTQNSKRNLVNSPLQYLRYFGKNPKYRKTLGIFRTVQSTRDKKLLISDVQEMAKVSDLREQVILETWLLGLRISDASILEWQQFTADEFQLITRKEQISAFIFVSPEFRELLNKYLNTIDKGNKYLFQSAKNVHLATKTFQVQVTVDAGFTYQWSMDNGATWHDNTYYQSIALSYGTVIHTLIRVQQNTQHTSPATISALFQITD